MVDCLSANRAELNVVAGSATLRHRQFDQPPSTISALPVMNALSSLAR
jgi:alkanesulfonate monooxygenase SsuD/methylene tetrahydromethanopterin reductase-like flavin-dependent oxidoreductase (luciferase family)